MTPPGPSTTAPAIVPLPNRVALVTLTPELEVRMPLRRSEPATTCTVLVVMLLLKVWLPLIVMGPLRLRRPVPGPVRVRTSAPVKPPANVRLLELLMSAVML